MFSWIHLLSYIAFLHSKMIHLSRKHNINRISFKVHLMMITVYYRQTFNQTELSSEIFDWKKNKGCPWLVWTNSASHRSITSPKRLPFDRATTPKRTLITHLTETFEARCQSNNQTVCTMKHREDKKHNDFICSSTKYTYFPNAELD
jgi:hypothetical protein